MTACALDPRRDPYLGAQPFPDPSHRRLGRFDQQRAVVAADGNPREVKALAEGDDARLPAYLTSTGEPAAACAASVPLRW